MTYYDGLSDGVGTLTPGTVVEHIDLSSESVHVYPGATTTVVGTLKTVGGRTVAGDPDGWEVDDTGIVTAVDGVLTYVSDGTTLARATYGAITSDDLLVVCGPVGAGPDEPVGMTVLFTHDFTEVSPDGWGPGLGYLSVINDVDSPGPPPASPGAPNVGQFYMPAYTWEGTAATGSTSSTIVLDSSASAVDNAYTGHLVSNEDNPLHPYRSIVSYVGSTRLATIGEWGTGSQPATWDVIPSNGSVTRIHAMTPGSGTAFIEVDPQPIMFAPTKFYACGYFKVNEDFQVNYNGPVIGSVVNKCFEVNAKSNYYGRQDPNIHCPEWTNAGPDLTDPTSPIKPLGINISGRTGGIFDNLAYHNMPQNENTSKTLLRGEWYFWQSLVVGSSVGTDDGSFQHWLQQIGVDENPVRVINYSGLRWETPVGALTRWCYFNLQNTYGGGGMPITNDNYYYQAAVYLSGGYVDSNDEPDAWTLTSYSGTTVAAGAKVNIIAQLNDLGGNPVNVFGFNPTFHATQSAVITPGMYCPVTFDSGTGTPPGAGEWRLNGTTLNSQVAGAVSHLYVSKHDRNGNDMSSMLDLLLIQDTLHFVRESDGNFWNFLVYSITPGGSGATAYYDIALWPDLAGVGNSFVSTPYLLPSDGENFLFYFTLQVGKSPQYVTIPGGLTAGQTVVVTCDDYALVNNGQQDTHRTSNSLILTVA